ncbi:uncharacterized protein BHQ10_007545 [Talaromyces amestolkiae]|uniref:Uncharacterized protein n=1 Tax=Talaromyces amestolkiae TaxID=1196081 RepID=A0A364L6Y4_TALAM|nr:uncharacterized protein BHQ10_007545 [Talaromyces amestolkiae]RAO71533.1 hypothetical protein BHQ10_007545 [Talaromyces amestolkiae]
MAASKVPSLIKELGQGTNYDRIEVANLADRHYLGPERILSLYGPLLQDPLRNSKATLIILFHDATAEMLFAEHIPTPESTHICASSCQWIERRYLVLGITLEHSTRLRTLTAF